MVEVSRGPAAPWLRDVAPVIPIVVFGGAWIAWHASGGRGGTHTMFQALALAENAIALLLRRRKPVGALAGILVVYALVDLDPIMILPVLLALMTVAELRQRRTAAVAALVTAAVVAAMPYLHGDQVNPVTGTLPHVLAVALAAAAGAWLQTRRHSAAPPG
jgi:uncharacterized membrane protein YfcA